MWLRISTIALAVSNEYVPKSHGYVDAQYVEPKETG
jgi:hypothetical protein